MFESITTWIAIDPRRRAVSLVSLTIGVSLLSGALIAELVVGNTIHWSDAIKSVYAWGLLALFLIYSLIQADIYKIDMKASWNIRKNNPYAYVEKKCLDQYATHCISLIAKGKLDEYHEAQNRLRGKEDLR